MLPRATVECGVVRDPEIRFSANGRAWATCRVVAKDRVRGANGEWTDGPPSFFDIVCFGKVAENLVESVRVGDSLLVHGKFAAHEWEKDGSKMISWRLTADEIGVSITWNPAKTPRALGDSGTSAAAAPAADPWATPDPAPDPWAVGSGEPPF